MEYHKQYFHLIDLQKTVRRLSNKDLEFQCSFNFLKMPLQPNRIFFTQSTSFVKVKHGQTLVECKLDFQITKYGLVYKIFLKMVSW